MKPLTAVVLGSTGLIGEQLVKQLLADPDFSKVTILVRKSVEMSHSKLLSQVVNFDDLADVKNAIGYGDCIFCCIGTTRQKVNGDMNVYKKVDVEIPANVAKMASDAGFSSFLLVSAVGANANTGNFYLKMKGEVEKAIAALPFTSFHVFRPSILYGDRKEFRLGELIGKGLMKVISNFFWGGLTKYSGIDAKNVAKAMSLAAKSDNKGMVVHHYTDMLRLTKPFNK